MPLNRIFLLYLIVATSAVPAIAQTLPSGGVAGGTTQTASVTDFSGTWRHPGFPWYEPPASGPGPITNLSRWPESVQSLSAAEAGTPALPPTTTGVSDYDQLV